MIFVKRIILKSIRIYQNTLSPDTGFFSFFYPYGYCRFHPTCSEYTYQAVSKYGILKGSLKGVYRVLRCNPFSRGGNDPLI